jgi:spermidine/putrescine transport system substrate-binding protein
MGWRGILLIFSSILLLGGVAGGLYYWLAMGDSPAGKKGDEGAKELVILTWEEYFDLELIGEFEKQLGIKVKWVYYEDDHDRDERLESNGTRGFDLVLVNERAMQIYRKKGWVASVREEDVPNLKNIDPQWFKRYARARNYAVPYFWGTTGIIYDSAVLPEAPTKWMDMFDPIPELQGKLQMPRDPKELAGPALQALGYSMYSDRLNDYDEAKALIAKQVPFVRDYGTPALNEESLIVKGEVLAAMTYNGDALMLQEFNENLEYVIPEEGASLWMDFFIVMMSSDNKDAAYKFLDFINEPEIAARNAEYVYYATPNLAAKQHVSAEYLENPVIFPPEEVLARCESFEPLPGWVRRQIDKLFLDVLPAEETGSE